MRPDRAAESGFSLIEALVAMAILAFSATALIGATEAYVGHVRGLEDRAVAQWAAENLLTELQLDRSQRQVPSRDIELLGRTWTATTAFTATNDPDLNRLVVSVAEQGSDAVLVRLNGFVDMGAP